MHQPLRTMSQMYICAQELLSSKHSQHVRRHPIWNITMTVVQQLNIQRVSDILVQLVSARTLLHPMPKWWYGLSSYQPLLSVIRPQIIFFHHPTILQAQRDMNNDLMYFMYKTPLYRIITVYQTWCLSLPNIFSNFILTITSKVVTEKMLIHMLQIRHLGYRKLNRLVQLWWILELNAYLSDSKTCALSTMWITGLVQW